jgi:hypothetical protein
MLEQRQPTEYMSRALGHSAPSVTSDIYMHVTKAMTGAVMSCLDRVFDDGGKMVPDANSHTDEKALSNAPSSSTAQHR